MLSDALKDRGDAYRVLLLWQKEGAYIKESGLTPFAMEIALGVCRRHLYLLYFIKKLVKKLPSLEVTTLIEMGLFQMFFMEVPDYASINTSVEIAKEAKLGEGSVRLINGVLRNARRQGLPELPTQKIQRISIEYSVPEWIVRRWFDIYGPKKAELLAKRKVEPAVEWIRVNLQKTTVAELIKKVGLTGSCIFYNRYIQMNPSVKLKSLLETESFLEGEFSFQNPAAFKVVELLDLKPGLKVWDACAAPGGKSALMAELHSSLNILASDVSNSRVIKMEQGIERLGLKNVKCQQIDALKYNEPESFDRILLDVPCSNMGVIARRPESIYRLTKSSIKELTELQLDLLEKSSVCLKHQGILVYATCSQDPEETTQVINRFLKRHKEYEKVEGGIYPKNKSDLDSEIDLGIDGFFAQALKKNLKGNDE